MTVTAEWGLLMNVLRLEAPKTGRNILPAVRRAPDMIRRAESSIGVTWPAQLHEFYALHNGESADYADAIPGSILPAHELFGTERVASDHAMMIEVWTALANGDNDYYPGGYANIVARHPTAGSRVAAFIPEYIPISGADSYYYFCDTRPSDHYGCIRAYDRDDADEAGPKWSSIADMLAAVRVSITHQTPLDGWKPTIRDEALIWEPAAL
ncbi:SMI1/KNR4 family protein [Williamsia sp. D3]|uniref:SMI1/KNR4 family protein n=1 Tax=Williamsia sp. D3 TaxID=1313067 RepID=UPI0003D2E330|nr:SMI1/KNR4 family protein [Williamsia sp. D3]ETD34357.1 hypothetical protein W823_03620 [Williamsia sp. D3]